MIKQIDKRNFESISEANKKSNFTELNKSLGPTITSNILDEKNISAFTGTPEKVINTDTKKHSSLISAGLEYLQQISPAMGFAHQGEAEFVPDPYIAETRGGSKVVHYKQYYRGIPVFQMGRSVHFDPESKILNAKGASIYITSEVNTIPKLNAAEAFEIANKYISNQKMEEFTDSWGVSNKVNFKDTSQYEPTIVARYSLPSEPTVLSKGPFGSEIPAHLSIFYTGSEYRLAWYYVINFAEPPVQYDAIISADDADSPEVLYFQETSKYFPKGKGNVYRFSGESNREEITFPASISELAVDINGGLPNGFPKDWIDTDKTRGNNTNAVLGNSSNSLSGTKNNNEIYFSPQDPVGDDQKVLNIFYFCNIMHDFFYLLGFDEAAGNFQKINFNLGGSSNDSVTARAHSGQIFGIANMRTPIDGQAPEMNMGLFGNSGRHTALDSDVVFHEFVHGVTNRLVGGRFNERALQMPQSGGMGEGWSDYFALSFRNYFFNAEKQVSGDWVTNNPNGIRGNPYDDQYPGTYGDIGSGRYTGVHPIGEIWCATLMHLTRELTGEFDKHRAYNLAWQVIVDGLKLTVPNPSFLDARDAILQAIDDYISMGMFKSLLNTMELRKAKEISWAAFAKFGMGINASSSHSGLSGITEDFKTP